MPNTFTFEDFSSKNGSICIADTSFVKYFFNEYSFIVPEFEELVFDYTVYETPYGLLSVKAEHGKWLGYSVEPKDGAIASEIGIYYNWISLSDVFNAPCYECGIACSSIYNDTGWSAIPDIIDVMRVQVPILNGMTKEENARVAYDDLCDALIQMGIR